MDDLLIFINTEEENLHLPETVVSCHKSEELQVSPKKCSIMIEETELLGLIVGRMVIEVNLKKADVVRA